MDLDYPLSISIPCTDQASTVSSCEILASGWNWMQAFGIKQAFRKPAAMVTRKNLKTNWIIILNLIVDVGFYDFPSVTLWSLPAEYKHWAPV